MRLRKKTLDRLVRDAVDRTLQEPNNLQLIERTLAANPWADRDQFFAVTRFVVEMRIRLRYETSVLFLEASGLLE